MKRFVGAAVVAASLVTLVATRPSGGGGQMAPADGGRARPAAATAAGRAAGLLAVDRYRLADFEVYDPEAGSTSLLVVPQQGRGADVLAALGDEGLAVRRVVDGMVEVDAGATPLSRLLGLPGVQAVAPPARAMSTAVTEAVAEPAAVGAGFGGEGAFDVGALRWHEAGILGAGVTVAVIDTGFDAWDIAASAGEVPATVAFDLDLCDRGLASTNHGTATSEILYDMAPRASLARVCIDDATDLAQAVPQLIAAGVDVVNMSLGFFNTGPGDGRGGPGSPDASARAAVEAGIVWVNSAGNEALVHHSGAFVDGDANGRHEWAPGDELLRFDLPPLTSVDVYLKWDQWTGAPADDFALCITDDPANPGTCLPSRVADRGLPTVSLGVRNPFEQTASLYARVERRAGVGAPRLDAFFLGASAIEYPVPPGSLADPAAVEGVVTVGAYCTRDGRELRPYSSQGPTLDGRPGISLIAPGSVSGLLFGAVVGCQGGYGGTSAAAPHVAGAAALVSEDLRRLHAERAVTASDIVHQLLRRTDRLGEGAPDPVTGFGRLSLGTPLSASTPPTTTTVPTTTTTAPPTTSTTAPGQPALDDFSLAVSESPNRSAPRPLAGATLSGLAHVFLTPVYPRSAVDQVRFSVDGRLVQVERNAGYDLGGGQGNRGYGFDTWRVGDGPHELEAVVVLEDGSRHVVRAPFSVDNGGRPAPPRPFTLAWSAPGGAPQALDGATVAGTATLSLLGAAASPVDHVLFYVDAVLAGYDGSAPYQSGTVDLSGLGPGQHASQVVVFHVDGSISTVNATFTV